MESVQESFQELVLQITNMQWSDYLDIIVVAYLLYRLLPMLWTSSTMRVFRTVISVVVLAWLTGILELYTLNFVLEQVIQVGLIAVLVLFQPELRRMMDHLGSIRLKKIFGAEKHNQDIETIVTQTVMACESMSRERVGALMVFARENRLDEFCKTGTVIDGQVSEQLIRNIFFPKASLHDGAMIFRDGKIAAAGCVLPLSDSERLHADLGTRHRAGVGISEVSDAVVVIVSEETGTISVAIDGMLTRHLAPQTLEKLLKNALCPEERTGDESLAVRLKQKLKKTNQKGERR